MTHLDPSSTGTTAGTAGPTAKVELLRWPADARRREELAAAHLPRLLLVEAGAVPPRLDPDEDWIRTPADERDVWTRLQRLARLHDRRRRRPRLSDGVVLHHCGRSVVVSEGEGAVLRPLLDRFGHLVRWDELVGALWPDGGGTVKLAVARVSRLRLRIADVGLVIHNIRGRGVLLDHGDPSTDAIDATDATYATPPPSTAVTGVQPEEDMWPIW